MGGQQCTASGGAPFHANVSFSNKTKDLTLQEPSKHVCSKEKCEKKHHAGLRVIQGKVPEAEPPSTQLGPLETTNFGISAREGTAAGPEGELTYHVYRGSEFYGSVWLKFSRDANSSTRSCGGTLSGAVNNGDYELSGSFPCDTINCVFELRPHRVEVRIKGQLNSQFGGGMLDVTVPIEDLLRLPELQRLLAEVEAANAHLGGLQSRVDKALPVLEQLAQQGVQVDFVSANKPEFVSALQQKVGRLVSWAKGS